MRRTPQVRRLRIQQRVKTGAIMEEDMTKQEFKSALPLLPPLVRRKLMGRHCSGSGADGPLRACTDRDQHQGLLHRVHHPGACADFLRRVHRADGRSEAGPWVRSQKSESPLPPITEGAPHRGTSYAEWVTSVGLPKQLSEVRCQSATFATTGR